jgi:TetR/AcrR family transcriptional repressor of nem operon
MATTRRHGGARTDDICQTAGVTKDAFFHHSQSKEERVVSAARYFSSMADSVFSTALYRDLPDPVDRLLGYVAFRKAILQGELPGYTCLLGTMVQVAYDTHPPIREACDKGISENTAMVEADIAEAMRKHDIEVEWSVRASRFAPRPSFRALSFSPKPSTALTLPPLASIICASI